MISAKFSHGLNRLKFCLQVIIGEDLHLKKNRDDNFMDTRRMSFLDLMIFGKIRGGKIRGDDHGSGFHC